MQLYTDLFKRFLEFDADTRHKLLSLIQTLRGNEFDFVCFQLFAPDQAVAAWNKTIPMTEDLFKQCQKIVNRMQAGSLIYQLYSDYPQFLPDEDPDLDKFLEYWESIKDLPEDQQKKLLDSWNPNSSQP